MQNEIKRVVTRVAPSPTGYFHIGTLRTALFNYLFAESHKGTYVLRIEDTDKERSKKEYEDDILESLKWLGIEHYAFFRQSEHLDVHKTYLKQLIDHGHAYISREESKEADKEGTKPMREVIRFRNKGEIVKFHDHVLGDIEVDTTDLGDFVIAKDFETPLYNFAVVVDDCNAGVTHVIRGQDHVSNTPRQILLYRALGKTEPEFAHLPLILATDKSKLSKRKHGESVSVRFYRQEGYLPEALINFVALIGWNPGGEKEIFSMNELLEVFDIDRVQKSPAVFNIEKLKWLNKEYIKKMTADDRAKKIREFIPESLSTMSEFDETVLRTLEPLITEHIDTFGDVRKMAEEGALTFFFKRPEISANALVFKNSNSVEAKLHLEKNLEILENIPENDWNNIEGMKAKIISYADTLPKRGPALYPLRFALSGREHSPDPFSIAAHIGKTETISRIKKAISSLS